jgi:hypothetical protein
MGLNKYIDSLENIFTERINKPFTIILFKKAVYIYILLNGLITLPIAAQLWSPAANTIHFYPVDDFGIKLLNILSRPDLNNYYWLFVVGQLLCCVVLLLGYKKRVTGILLYFITANLYYNARLVQNGGTNLLLLTLLYMIFINEDAEQHENKNLRITDLTISNFAFLAAQIQVCVLYFVSSVYKLYGSHWIDGSALYYILNIDEYSTSWIQQHIANRDWLTVSVTYFTLGFQLLFPITIWIKKLKPITLWIGIVFHVLIILMLGLTDFGLIMLVMYLLFVSNKKSELVLNKLKLS